MRRIVDAEEVNYNGERRIRLHFSLDGETLSLIRDLPGCRWSPLMQSWHISVVPEFIEHLNNRYGGKLLFRDITPGEGLRDFHEKEPERKILITHHRKNHELSLKFFYDPQLVELIKTLEHHRFDPVTREWFIEISQGNNSRLKAYLNKNGYRINYGEVEKEMIDGRHPFIHKQMVPEQFRQEMQFRNYSDQTRKQYISNVNKFLNECSNDPDIDEEAINRFIREISAARKYSTIYQHQLICSIKLYFRLIHHRELKGLRIYRPNIRPKPRVVLEKKEVESLILSTPNYRHQTMIITLYDTGLRLNELLNLRIEDIHPDRRIIHVHGGKGKKDRIVPLGQFLKRRLDMYKKYYHPLVYLFEGRGGGKYSARGVQSMLSRSLERAGIKKPATVHTLRHSYATHMLQAGADPELLKFVLGHKQLRTTQKYFHKLDEDILKLISPFDDLDLSIM